MVHMLLCGGLFTGSDKYNQVRFKKIRSPIHGYSSRICTMSEQSFGLKALQESNEGLLVSVILEMWTFTLFIGYTESLDDVLLLPMSPPPRVDWASNRVLFRFWAIPTRMMTMKKAIEIMGEICLVQNINRLKGGTKQEIHHIQNYILLVALQCEADKSRHQRKRI